MTVTDEPPPEVKIQQAKQASEEIRNRLRIKATQHRPPKL
jgi:hypothetical protein